jgi:hypothetical protein
VQEVERSTPTRFANVGIAGTRRRRHYQFNFERNCSFRGAARPCPYMFLTNGNIDGRAGVGRDGSRAGLLDRLAGVFREIRDGRN